MVTNLVWRQCKGTWCHLMTADLDHDMFNVGGVYVIWHGGPPSRAVKTGNAAHIGKRLAEHRHDSKITGYSREGPLYFTWAEVDSASQNGVERYLADALHPLVDAPIPVNLP